MTRYSQWQLQQIWTNTTRPINHLWRSLYPSDAALDELGHIICFSQYGKFDSCYGWEVDHRQPSALGGNHNFLNLRALSCSKNRSLGGLLGGLK